ncbi:MAG: T9SS type A sorting domain-containing protein [Bacteroidetes bacterium]|nr:T9SS type A sorting domain-containing protein [Bacteroidota bacterium]
MGFHIQAQTLYPFSNKNLGGTQSDVPIGFEQLPDSGYIILASSSSNMGFDKSQNNRDPSGMSSDFWLIRLDKNGNKLWDKTIGGSSSDRPAALLVLADGYVLSGTSSSGISGEKTDSVRGGDDFWIVKTDLLGNVMWDRTVGGLSNDELTCMAYTTDHHLVLGGWTLSPIGADKISAPFGDFDFWWVKLDTLGNFILEKTLGGLLGDNCFGMTPTTDNGVIMAGYSNSPVSFTKTQPSQGLYDYWVLKVDSVGRKIWDKTIGGQGDDYAFSVCSMPGLNNGYVVGGFSFSGISGNKSEANRGQDDFWAIRITTLGNVVWDKTFGGDLEDELSRVMISRQNEILLSGTSYSNLSGDKTEMNLGAEQTWMVLCDTSGNKILDKTFFTTGHDEYGQVISDFQGCYTSINYTISDTGGYRTFNNNGGGDIWISKVCPFSVGVEEVRSEKQSMSAFYNNSTGMLEVTTNGPSSNNSIFQIYSVNGQLMMEEGFDSINSPFKINFNVEGWTSNVYFLRWISENENTSIKFIKN